MTIVELMVAVGITMVIMALSVKFFQGQFKSYYGGKETKKIQESNCDVGELLRRDLAGAGYGVYPQMAFYFADGGTLGSDQIWVSDSSGVGDMSLVSSPCPAGVQYTTSGAQMTIPTDTSTLAKFYNPLDTDATHYPWVISDVTSTSAQKKVARITGQPTGGGSVSLTNNLTVGSNSYVAPAVSYYLSGIYGTDLVRFDRNSGGEQVIARNVVDLQVAYQVTPPNWLGVAGCSGAGSCYMSTFDPRLISLIRVSVVTRSEDKSGTPSSLQYCRPAVENRLGDALGSASCGYIYRTYTFTVKPRNAQDPNTILPE
jgi:Tfp pilus assembly protein PilW